MIVVDLAHLNDQVVATPNMQNAINFLLSTRHEDLPDGNIVIDGHRVYAEIQSYETVEGEVNRFEGHRKSIDLQYVAKGEEITGWTSAAYVAETTPYVQAHDYWLERVADLVSRPVLSPAGTSGDQPGVETPGDGPRPDT